MPQPTHDQIKELISLVGEKGIEELELENGEFHLKIVGRKAPAQIIAAPAAPAIAGVSAQELGGATPLPVPASAAAPAAAEPPKDEDANLKKITAPMVGTFYRAPSPESLPFIEVGDRVDEDTVMCIIEAMKLMNEIKAEVRGVVRKVLVENGQPIEYGQPMFAIEPS
ncbi:acetyl-CoA carboxylase biotin carboxyl carrier protein [bacterium]|nr:acetyl-CoA carboxylase biotin carboxyl carrier protein [bacterium]